MRKFISVILCMAMLMGMAVSVGAAEINAELTEPQKEALDMLSALDIVRDLDENTLNPEMPVTRGEFAVYASRLIKAAENNDKVYFYDVPKNHYSCSAVAALVDRGVLTGWGDNKFSPDEEMNLNDACVVIVKLLGYQSLAEAYGDYPYGYQSVTGNLELLKNCTGSSLTIRNLLPLLKNAMLAPMMEANGVKNGAVQYHSGDNTILSVYFDSYYDKGTVTNIRNMGMNGQEHLKRNVMNIDDASYNYADMGMEDYFGREVNFIYSEDSDDERTVIWARPTKNSDYADVFVHDGNCTFDRNTMKIKVYSDDNKYKEYTVPQNAVLIKNGENYTGDIAELFNDDCYTLRVISSKNDNKYNIIIVMQYEDFSVEGVDKENRKLIGDNQKTYILDEGKADYIDFYDSGMTSIDFDDIAEKDIISIAKSESGNTVRVLVSKKQAEGTVTSVTKREGCFAAVIDNTEYLCRRNELYDKLKSGNRVKVHLNVFSYIYDVEENSSDEIMAFIIKIMKADEPEDNVIFKALNENGEIKNYASAKKITIDEKKYSKADEIIKNFKGVRQLVKCRLNSNGEVTRMEILTPENTVVRSDNLPYKTATMKLGPKILLNSSTTVFAIPSHIDIDTASDDEFFIKKVSDLQNDAYYSASSYVLDKEKTSAADALVVEGYSWGTQNNWAASILIEDITIGINEDDEAVNYIEGYQGKTAVKLMCTADFDAAAKGYGSGDVVRATTNRRGEVTNLSLYYRPSDELILKSDGSFNAGIRHVISRVTDRTGGIVKIRYNDTTLQDSYDEIFNLTNIPVLVYDTESKNGEIRVGTYSDIITASVVVINTNFENIRMAVVYK